MRIGDLRGALRYISIVTASTLGILLLVELTVWLIIPERYQNPPAVTIDAWISSDALGGQDMVWMKEFVAEFCRSYTARWTSYIYFRRRPFAGKHINVDSAGLRFTPQFGRHAPDGHYEPLVFLFGGSTMWGTGARDSGTIPSALSRLIGPAPSRARVVNMGESGYVSTQAILSLELELRRGNIPDIVILYDGVNDVFSAHQNGEAGLPQNEMHRAEEFNLLKDGARMRELGMGDLWKRTVTAGMVEWLHGLTAPPPTTPRPGVAAEVIRLYRENLALMEALSRHYGFRYEAYWQPVVFTRANPSPYEKAQSELMQDVRPLFLEAYRLAATDSLLRTNPHFHNMSGIFDSTEFTVYLDFCHLSERGNAIVAERIDADLKRSDGSPKWKFPSRP